MHVRILAGVGAWLLGVGAATAGSLLAVSLLGQGIAESPGQQLTTAAVNRALAREAREASQAARAGSPPASSPAPSSRRTGPAAPRPAETQPAGAGGTASATPAPSRAAASPSAQDGVGTVLTSPGGTVLAECRQAGAYLVSWSPVQGYEASSVARGPAPQARVVFESGAETVTMTVTCPDGTAGVPVVASDAHGWRGGGDE